MAEIISSVSSWLTPTSLFILINLVIGTIAVISSFGKEKKHQQQQQQQLMSSSRSTGYHESASTPPPPPPHQLSRNPSLLSRVTSFGYLCNNYSSSSPYPSFRSEPEYAQTIPFPASSSTAETTHDEDLNPPSINTPLARAPSFLSRMTSFNLSFRRETSAETVTTNEPQQQQTMERTVSEPTEVAEAAEEAVGKMRKTASEKTRSKKKVTPAPEEVARKSAGTPTGTGRLIRNRGRETSSYDEEVDAKADDFINKFKQQLKLQRLDSLLRGRNINN